MNIIHIHGGRQFSSETGVTLLEAASAAGISLPYSCRTARCSTCKALVKRGQTRPLFNETGLSAEEIKAGWILTCAHTAETDVELDIEELDGTTLPQPKTLPCRIKELEKVAPNILRVRLKLPPALNFNFIPGQYIDIIGANGLRRSYSLANANYSEKFLELHIRAVNSGAMSDYWFNNAKINDLLRLNGPLGTFFLREYKGVDIFFLATGTGIAPVKAMLESLAHVHEELLPKSVTVLWGASKPEDFYCDISSIPGRHRYIPVLSRAHLGWSGAKGYVQDVLLSIQPDLSRAVIYACGSASMINSSKMALCNAGLTSSQYFSDAFVSSGAKKL